MSDNAPTPPLPPAFATLALEMALDPEPPHFDLPADAPGFFDVEPEAPAPGRRHYPKRDGTRSRTISIKRLSKRELHRVALQYPPEETASYADQRPTTRAECLHGPQAQRPCPWVSCKHHLALDVNDRTGSIKLNFPDVEVWDMPETCTLDVADRGGITLEDIGHIMNLTRERIRQLETKGIAKLRGLGHLRIFGDYLDHIERGHHDPYLYAGGEGGRFGDSSCDEQAELLNNALEAAGWKRRGDTWRDPHGIPQSTREAHAVARAMLNDAET